MYKYSRYAFYIKNVIICIICINLFLSFEYMSLKAFCVIGVFIALIINDYLRYKFFYRYYNKYYISFLISFIIGVWFLFTYNDFYFYALLFEMLIFFNKKVLKIFLITHILIFLGSRHIYSNDVISHIFLADYWRKNGLDFLQSTLFYIMGICIFLYIRAEWKGRIDAQNLNDELNRAYDKLKEYSSKVEELTIAKERNRVASEIHDSLGHSLTALIMHLDFLENVVDKDTEKTKVMISKCQSLARGSMEGLRRAVYALKEEEHSKGLKTSINELIDNFIINEGIKIRLTLEESIENISPDIKNIIYRTVQEGLTNGIRHGKATEISIDIFYKNDGIEFKIKDNGVGLEEIAMGNGLGNIEKRIDLVGGRVTFSSRIHEGFSIDAYIPLKEVKTVV